MSASVESAAPPHADDLAVDAFALHLKEKLARARAKGRGGWQDKGECTADSLSRMLREHVDKGDPVDVAAFAMFLALRGEGITPAPGAKLEFNLPEIEALLGFFGGEDTTMTVQDYPNGMQDGERPLPAGKYAWCAECPEEGGVWLGSPESDR